jgi:hypothetical protein
MLDWDKEGVYRLAALQSTPGRQLLVRCDGVDRAHSWLSHSVVCSTMAAVAHDSGRAKQARQGVVCKCLGFEEHRVQRPLMQLHVCFAGVVHALSRSC